MGRGAAGVYRLFTVASKPDAGRKSGGSVTRAQALAGRGEERVGVPLMPLKREERVRVALNLREAHRAREHLAAAEHT